MDLRDELEAVNVTIVKWEKLEFHIISINKYTSEPCGFCKVYACASDTCPASKRCNEISKIYDAQYTIRKEIIKNLSWLKKRKTMLLKKIKRAHEERRA